MPDPIFAPTLRDLLSQGDLVSRVTVVEYREGQPISGEYDVVVLMHDCEIDKPGNHILLCVRARQVADLAPGQIGDVRRGRVNNAMHLPAVRNSPESFIDFRMIYRVPRREIDRGLREGRRVASMTEDGRTAMITYLYKYFARRMPDPAAMEGQP